MPWAPDYVTLNDFKEYKRIELPDATDDAVLALNISAASRAIDLATNRQFGQVDIVESRFYTALFDTKRRRWIIDIDDLMDDTGLLVNIDADDDGTFDDPIVDFRLHPFNAGNKSEPWVTIIVDKGSSVLPSRKEGDVRVTGLFGWTNVPDTIKEATLLQADRFFTRKNAPFGVAGSPEIGSEVRLLSRIDPDVRVMVDSFKRWWGVV